VNDLLGKVGEGVILCLRPIETGSASIEEDMLVELLSGVNNPEETSFGCGSGDASVCVDMVCETAFIDGGE
jgi:hypothetical protein